MQYNNNTTTRSESRRKTGKGWMLSASPAGDIARRGRGASPAAAAAAHRLREHERVKTNYKRKTPRIHHKVRLHRTESKRQGVAGKGAPSCDNENDDPPPAPRPPSCRPCSSIDVFVDTRQEGGHPPDAPRPRLAQMPPFSCDIAGSPVGWSRDVEAHGASFYHAELRRTR